MKKLTNWIKKNKTLTLMCSALLLVLLVFFMFTSSNNENIQQLTSSIFGTQEDINIEEVGEETVSIQTDDVGTSTCTGAGGECKNNNDRGAPPNGCDNISGTIGCGQTQSCCRITPSPQPGQQNCPGDPGCPSEEEPPPTCSSLGGQCWPLSDTNSCGSVYISATGCNENIMVCCVQEETTEPLSTPHPSQSAGSPSNPGTGGQSPAPSLTPNNICGQAVTCGTCNESCSSGVGSCQTCTTSDNSCTYKQACGDGDTDPIYGQTCGKGDFTNETRQQRKDPVDGYTHVSCTGTSVCTGGPNTHGGYWCIDEGNVPAPTSSPGETCTLASIYKPHENCDTGCAQFKSCTSGQKFDRCVEAARCQFISPTPTESENENPADNGQGGSAPPSEFTLNVRPSQNCGGHMEIYWTAPTGNVSNGYWIYRAPASSGPSFTPSSTNLIAGPISSNMTSSAPYYDWLSKPQEMFYYKVIASGSGGNRTSNAAYAQASVACGGSNTQPTPTATPQPTPTSTSTEDTSSPVAGLTVTARTSQYCGGHAEIYWTAGNGSAENGYWLYRGTTGNFTPSSSNLIAGPISSNMTSSAPYYDWATEPGKTYYYRVIRSSSNGNSTSSSASTVMSPACN